MTSAAASTVGRRVALLWVTMALASPAQARDTRPEVRAVTILLPPSVVEEGGQLTGFSIDLWNEVAARLGPSWQDKTRYAYAKVPTTINRIGAAFVEISAMGAISTPEFLLMDNQNGVNVTV